MSDVERETKDEGRGTIRLSSQRSGRLSSIVIGTAGHVDHGKTELIKALTGIDTDRLKEEKEREMSIDLGFAWLDLPKSARVGIIDVPGHEKFLKNMLAGVGGVDVALFVVAADEGVMPQTREHFEIMRLLGVKAMIIAISKKDLADEETIELVKKDIKNLLAGTSLEGAEMVITSSKTNEGLELLKTRLDEVCSTIAEKPISDLPRLFIDRVFAMKGFGTVITGTLASGRIKEGDALCVYPRGLKTKARQIQVHHETKKEALPGERVALNLRGIKKHEIKRGCVISKEGRLRAIKRATIILDILPSVKVLKDWTRVKLYIGSAEILGRVSFIGAKGKKGGESAFAQIVLEEEGTFLPFDRFVIRNYSPLWLIGGGKILDISPKKIKKSDRDILPKLDRINKGGHKEAILIKLEEKPLKEEELSGEIGLSLEALRKIIAKLQEEGEVANFGPYITNRENLISMKESILSTISDFYKKYPLRSYMSRRELRQRFPMGEEIFAEFIPRVEEIECRGERVFLKGRKPELKKEELTKRNKIEQDFLKARFNPPKPRFHTERGKPEDSDVFRTLIEDETIVKIGEDVWLHRKVLEQGKRKIGALIKDNGAVTISEIRDKLATSRKYAVPLMQYLDSIGFTKRVGDKRLLRN